MIGGVEMFLSIIRLIMCVCSGVIVYWSIVSRKLPHGILEWAIIAATIITVITI